MKKLVLLSLVLVLVLAASLPGFTAGPKWNWKLASVLNASHPVNKALDFFCTRVGQLTNGQAKITLFPGGQMGQESDYLQGCRVGSIEFTKISASPLAQYAPRMNAFSLPFIFRNSAHEFHVVDGKIGTQLFGDLEASGFKGLAYMDAGFRSFSTRDKPVRVPADLKGLKVRVQQAKLMLDMVASFGATAVPLGMSDVYTALQTKVIDGWENNEPTVLQANMQEVCKYFSYTRHSAVPDVLIMNYTLYNSLPMPIQKAIMQASSEATTMQRKIWADMMGDTVAQLKQKGMIFNEVDNIKDFQKVVQPVVKQYEKQIGPSLIKNISDTQ